MKTTVIINFFFLHFQLIAHIKTALKISSNQLKYLINEFLNDK